ncbi:hypothetical protein J4E83_010303 [Alternaria metachromatica]|uniref:uncharacterized protein n=1 Tax=Alternaria metachromatica TaxID=283354 RepID=UPI0020C44C92|nr:uncharacterized protein J4E83_010303 [Alternaria metachromatica]KAI4606036.1 hypothetical protein J4E83_010303 [Alternaria metachromatica]
MPEVEAGDALPGMGAGGAAAPIADNAEEFGVNEPKKDPLDEEEDSSAQDPLPPKKDTSSSKKRTEPHHSATSPERSQLDQKFTKLDRDEVDISTSSSKGQEMDARAQRVADAVGKSKGAGDEVVRKNGGHADVEELHGATSLESGDRSKDGKKGGQDEKSGSGSGSGKGGKGDAEGVEAHLGDKVQREQAKKFGVNLDN